MKTSLSLSEMAVQMENLLHTLIPFKRASLSGLETSKKLDLEQTAAWWDKLIENAHEELSILLEHATALGLETPKPPDADYEKRKQDLQDSYIAGTMTASEKLAAQKLLGIESPGINDDPAAASRFIATHWPGDPKGSPYNPDGTEKAGAA